MAQSVSMGATMKCSFGAAPASLLVPDPRVLGEGPPTANIMDQKTGANVPTFGTCCAPTQPSMVSAGTPGPCVPVLMPWAPGSPTVLVRGNPALNSDSVAVCTAFFGVVDLVVPQTTREMIP